LSMRTVFPEARISVLLVQGPWLLIFPLQVYCWILSVIEQSNCLEDNTVIFLVGCIIPLAVSCNCCFDGIFEQHLSVLGPCLRALDRHLRMPGQVHGGYYSSYYFFVASNAEWYLSQKKLEIPLSQAFPPSSWLEALQMKDPLFSSSLSVQLFFKMSLLQLVQCIHLQLRNHGQLFLEMYLLKLAQCILLQLRNHVFRLCKCIQTFSSNCNCCYLVVVNPRYGGYGPCLMAPVWHRWMLWSAPHGLGMHRVFASYLANFCCSTINSEATIYVYAIRGELWAAEPTLPAHFASNRDYLALWLETYNLPVTLVTVSFK